MASAEFASLSCANRKRESLNRQDLDQHVHVPYLLLNYLIMNYYKLLNQSYEFWL